MEIVNYTDFRSRLKYWLDKAIDDASDIIIKRKNGRDLVLVPLDEYNSWKETNYLLAGENGQRLKESIKELENSEAGQKCRIEDL